MAERCTGHCCRAFTLNLSPDEIVRALWALLTSDDNAFYDDEGELRHVTWRDFEQIALMVVPLGRLMVPPGVTWFPQGEPPFWFYTCRNLLPSGDCGVYETRPSMCSQFPYADRGHVCPYDACTARFDPPVEVGEVHKKEAADAA